MKITPLISLRVAQINQKLYSEWKDMLFIKVPKIRDPESGMSLKEFVTLALTSTEITEEDRKRFNNYLESGVLDETEEIVDEKASIEYSKELDRILLENCDKGKLPKYIKKIIIKKQNEK